MVQKGDENSWAVRVTNIEVLAKGITSRIHWGQIISRRTKLVGHISKHGSLTKSAIEVLLKVESRAIGKV